MHVKEECRKNARPQFWNHLNINNSLTTSNCSANVSYTTKHENLHKLQVVQPRLRGKRSFCRGLSQTSDVRPNL